MLYGVCAFPCDLTCKCELVTSSEASEGVGERVMV